jgi:hypothetical protein
MSETFEQFKKLSSKFNSTYDQDQSSAELPTLVDNIEQKVDDICNNTSSLISTSQQVDIVLKDQKYLLLELHELISETREVMDILKATLKQGSRSSLFDAYSKLANAVKDQLVELRNLNKVIVDLEMFKNNPIQQPDAKVTLTLNGVDMLEKLLEIRKSAEINAINAEFEDLSNEQSIK